MRRISIDLSEGDQETLRDHVSLSVKFKTPDPLLTSFIVVIMACLDQDKPIPWGAKSLICPVMSEEDEEMEKWLDENIQQGE